MYIYIYYIYIYIYNIGIGTDGARTVAAAATTQLQQRYISSRFSSSVDEWPPYQSKHYTTLAFIHNKTKHADVVRFSVAQELAVAGKIHTAQPYKLSDLNVNMTKNISDIFLPVKASDGSFIDLHILIEGAPGIGKTVLAKEIAYQWAKGELLTSKKLLLLVFLRECSQTQLRSIEQLIQYVFRNDETASHLTKYLSKAEGEDVIIVFDGFDEISEENRKESVIVDIINRRILAKSCLVITSRPTASSSLHGSVDRRVEMVGFTEEDRLNYIQTALENCDEQVKALQHYLQSNPTINALCYIPLNMTILLCLVEDEIKTLPKTQTGMYKNFIQMTIVRFIKKYRNCDTVVNIANLPHPHDKLFVELATFAYEALKTDKIVFTLPEIKESCPNLTMTSSNWNGLGLLKAVQCFSAKVGNDQVTFHFLHFSIQEYMAAWYISTLPDKRQIKLIKKTFWEPRYYNTWIMYIGITSGRSFALRHFLSGNWFQFYSKLFKNSKVCNKYLKNKMRCLHLFQCLVEANKEDIIVSVKQLFQSNLIDLSNQTLLPSDLNTLGFFLVRSINKEWDELDLSNCNIGSEGSNILCNRFLDNDIRCIFTIKMVNFSYNQLTLSSFIRLFGLFNSWNTSEVIITDDAILDSTTDIKAIEDIILQLSTLSVFLIGSYLFSRNVQLSKMLCILANTTNIRRMYLLNCSWKASDSNASELLTLLKKLKLYKVRVIGPSLDEVFIKTMASILLHNNDSVNMFIYDPTMPDEIADNILSLSKDILGVMLIISSSKVQGIVNTYALSNKLSVLELFNLYMYSRYVNTKMCQWKEKLEGNSHNTEMIYPFVELLYKIKFNWNLKITVRERNILIVHNTKFEDLNTLFDFSNSASVVYLSCCNVSKYEYGIIIKTCSNLHILNSLYCVELLRSQLLLKRFVPNELFICGSIDRGVLDNLVELISHYHHSISAVLIANNANVLIYPNSKQVAQIFELQTSPTLWIQYAAVNASIFYQIIDAITTLHTKWTEIDFTGCNIGDIECEIMHRESTRFKNHLLSVKKLTISINKLNILRISYLVRIVSIWGIQELSVNGTDDFLYNYLIKKLTDEINHQDKVIFTVTHNHEKIQIVLNKNFSAISMNTPVSEMYVINFDLESSSLKEITSCLKKPHNLLRLRIINGAVSKNVLIKLLQTFSNEVSIINVRISDDDKMVKNLITSKELYFDKKINVVVSTQHWLCVYNLTKYQLHFIHQYFMNQMQPGMTLLKKFEQINGDKMYVFEKSLPNLIRFCAKVVQATGGTQIIAALSNTSSLNTIEIDKYSITNKTADNLAVILQCSSQLKTLHLNGNSLQTSSAIKISKALCSIPTFSFCKYKTPTLSKITSEANLEITDSIKPMSLHNVITLTKFSLSNNSITYQAADAIAAVISCSIFLQELNLGGNNLQALGTIKIARSLQNISSLTKLYIDHNNITHEAADDIAAAISCNVCLQELNLGSNNLQTSGTIKIARGLRKNSSLRKLYINHNNITDEAADDIAAAISCNSHLQELNLGSNYLQTSGIIKITKSLQEISSLTKLYINHNNITDDAADDIAAAISCNSHLQELNLGSNYLQTSGIIKITKSLQKVSSLTKLYINHNNITHEAADDIAAAISCNTEMEDLDVSGNNLKTVGIKKIAQQMQHICTLKKLCFSNNNIGNEAAHDIAAAISCNIHLQELNIGNNDFTPPGALTIARSLLKILTLTKLYFHGNCINDNKKCLYNKPITNKAINDFATAISCNTDLQELNLGSTGLQTSDAIKIARGLQKISSLTKLYINHNNITDEAADDIAAVICCNSHLQELNLGSNYLQTSGIIKITKSLQKISSLTKLYINHNNITCEAADDIAAAISCNTKLQEFDISGNNQTTGVIKIIKALKVNSTLRKLYLSNNNITGGVAYDIAAVISCNTELEDLDVSGNNLETVGIKKLHNRCSIFVH